jgi:murein DD-endopeptidase MepM/ murein hydrolase activator NlpD
MAEGRECGNGVRIDHGDGWETQYCHMKRGSIRVAVDEDVGRGQPLGLVGLSGRTEFPHLHVHVERDGEAVDPFLGTGGGGACALGAAPLWRPEALELLAYQGTALYNAGFAGEAPAGEKIIEGAYRRVEFPSDTPALVFWMEAFGVRAGDRLHLRLEGPNGLVAESEDLLIKDQARRWAFVGRKRPGEAWPSGIYRGDASLRRETADGPVSWRTSRSVKVR